MSKISTGVYIKLKDLDMTKYGEETVYVKSLEKILLKRQHDNMPKEDYRWMQIELKTYGYSLEILSYHVGLSKTSMWQQFNEYRPMSKRTYNIFKELILEGRKKYNKLPLWADKEL